MGEKEKGFMPQSSAGLMRYAEAETKIKLTPTHVVVASTVFGAMIVVLKIFA